MYFVVLGAIALLWVVDFVSAQVGFRQPAGPGYAERNACPTRCSIAGPNPSNWSVYHNFDQFHACEQSRFYDFSLYDKVDDANAFHRIYACSSYGPDWTNLPKAKTDVATIQSVGKNTTYELGWWSDGGKLDESGISSLATQLREYLANGYAPTDRMVTLFAQSGQTAVGLYIGRGLQNEGVGTFALEALDTKLLHLKLSASSMAMQLCRPGSDSDQVFGFMATTNGTFGPIQNALKTWANADCLSFPDSRNFTGPAYFTAPMVATTKFPADREKFTKAARSSRLISRANCKTIQVQSGDSCASLAKKCAISAADFTKYNPASNFCSSLKPGQHVCCSSGTLPDFRPKPKPDGSCFPYKFTSGDSCSSVAAANSLTVAELEKFNQKTWGWNGCSNVWAGTIACLSSGKPPFPATVPNAICGPQVPGTKPPTDGSDISKLNPCPLNACCNVWGQCGITDEFCIDTGTGAPGTAKPGTHGCISNCGTQIVRGSAPATFIKLGYFQGYSFSSRKCLYQEALQIDRSQYTHLHFAFGSISPDYQIYIGDALTSYEFHNFKRVRGPKRILSFGGWDFSTNPKTYNILRQGVMPANRLKLATNLANFIKEHDLDGIDIDWEYPSAPDLPNIPPGSKEEGTNYLAFLVVLKNLLPGKSVSIAAPASYWYLKGFPINQIGKIVDYIVFMTYDLHGQWDAQNPNSQIGCPSGMCLRSNVNLTETVSSLVMVTKAGVPSNKVIVGVTSYGRSFEMAAAGCHTPDCFYTGGPLNSNAAKGVCTGTSGYIANAEIYDIIKDPSRVNKHYVDAKSNTNILVYDNNQWVGYMSPEIRNSRTNLYKSLNMGGIINWAIDLETYHDPPSHLKDWDDFLQRLRSGDDPYRIGDRTGNWTELDCNDPAIRLAMEFTPAERWARLDCDHAWQDAVDVWNTHDKHKGDKSDKRRFIRSIVNTLQGPEDADCNDVFGTNCGASWPCGSFTGPSTGPAASLIWISLTNVWEVYHDFVEALVTAAALTINPALDDFENKFGPVKETDSDAWRTILLDLITIGTGGIAGPFFDKFLKNKPFFAGKDSRIETSAETAASLVAVGTTFAKELGKSSSVGNWTEEKRDEFSHYMGQCIDAWRAIASSSLEELFDGNETSIKTLTSVISKGKLIPGKSAAELAKRQTGGFDIATSDQPAEVAKAFFTFAIPSIWTASGFFPFIIDSGYPCGTVDPLEKYLSKETMKMTAGCVDDKLYFLAHPDGVAQSVHHYPNGYEQIVNNKFSAPPGLDSLGPMSFGGASLSDLIKGSVRTYKQNGNMNGGKIADPSDKSTLEELLKQDVTTPGFVRLPVCSPERAFDSWLGVNRKPDTSAPNYPCSLKLGIGNCGSTDIVDQTSDASPKVSDCMQIIKNIEGTDGEWSVEAVVGSHHQIAEHASCRFGVQAKSVNGNAQFFVGAQDIIDIINDSVRQFGGSGRVGTKGTMSCKGSVKGQDIEWGLF